MCRRCRARSRIVERELDLKGGAASFLMRIRPYRTIQNVIDGVVITFADITANKRAQRTREVLIDELQHRTRNLLAVVQSISDTTLAEAGSLADYAAEFNNRLQALARVQGLLSRREDATVTLTEIVQAELAAVGVTPDGERIVVDGPPVTLPHQTMQLLALALHELATNALKHGALKGARGRLNVTWQILDRTEKPHLELTWVESGVELDEQKAELIAPWLWPRTARAGYTLSTRRQDTVRTGKGWDALLACHSVGKTGRAETMMVSIAGATSRRVLVVEDEYLIAKRIAGEFAKLGIETVGPAGTVARALDLIAHGDHLDGATLDIKVRDAKVFAVADALQARGVPFVFATGYDQEAIPTRRHDTVRTPEGRDGWWLRTSPPKHKQREL